VTGSAFDLTFTRLKPNVEPGLEFMLFVLSGVTRLTNRQQWSTSRRRSSRMLALPFIPVNSGNIWKILTEPAQAQHSPISARQHRKRMRILIVDDHPMVIEGCRGMLSAQPDIEILEAHNADEALEAHASASPDVVVLDINLPGVSGFELLRRMLKRNPDSKIIIFSMNDDPVFAARSIEQGAQGYIAKNEDPKAFVKAIRAVAGGERYLSSELALKLAFAEQKLGANPFDGLSGREVEILRNLAEGKDMLEIAHLLKVSYKTVANNCTLLKAKLGARSRADLIRIAVENRTSSKLG
jgi:two-component system, NarL family, invasion response regulator UvrY